MDTLNGGIGVDVESAGGEEVVNVLGRLHDVTLNIHGETRGLGDGETEVEGDDGGNDAEADKETPHLVNVREDGGVIVKD